MTKITMGKTSDGAFYLAEVDENDEIIEKVELNPTSNGMGEIAFRTSDGVEKRGEVDPGGASDKGVGR